MQYQDGVRYSVVLRIDKSCQSTSLSLHGGDSEGVGCGDCLGTNCPFELLTRVGGVGGVGILAAGCLMAFAGDGGGACRMTGVLGE
jgi:hypothetical protein